MLTREQKDYVVSLIKPPYECGAVHNVIYNIKDFFDQPDMRFSKGSIVCNALEKVTYLKYVNMKGYDFITKENLDLPDWLKGLKAESKTERELLFTIERTRPSKKNPNGICIRKKKEEIIVTLVNILKTDSSVIDKNNLIQYLNFDYVLLTDTGVKKAKDCIKKLTYSSAIIFKDEIEESMLNFTGSQIILKIPSEKITYISTPDTFQNMEFIDAKFCNFSINGSIKDAFTQIYDKFIEDCVSCHIMDMKELK